MIEEAKRTAELLQHCGSHTDGTGCLDCPYNLLDKENDPCVNQLFRKGAEILRQLPVLFNSYNMLLREAEKLANERDECFHQLVQYAKIKKLVQDYINRNHIGCSESIYQMDRPQVEAIDLVAELCRIVGWYESQEEI